MNLLEIYISKNSNADWSHKHFSIARGMAGRMFQYTNTNFRTQSAFINAYNKFLEVENVPRSSWPKQPNHGQEIHKQYVINMIQSKIFKKGSDNLYKQTEKGISYGKFISNNFTSNERWLINYVYLLNGYFNNRKNYIVNRLREDILGTLSDVEYLSDNNIALITSEFFKATTFQEAVKQPFFYVHSFYDDSDFLINYFQSSEFEKNELYNYILGNIGGKNYRCCISKKYQPSGNFQFAGLIDEARVFFITYSLLSTDGVNTSNIIDLLISTFSQGVGGVDVHNIGDYFQNNKEVFDPIFTEVLEIEDKAIQDIGTIGEPEESFIVVAEDSPEDFIDETNREGKRKLEEVFRKKKKQALLQSEFKCGLEDINGCNSIYFTAKKTNNNYLEVHHFIPKEFRNDFSFSIDVLANYVTLCPRCHKQIHLALDRERKHLIHYLYKQRIERLRVVGLYLDESNLRKYYNVEN